MLYINQFLRFKAYLTVLEPGRNDSHVNVTGIFAVSLRSVNYRFWYHSGCSGQNANGYTHQIIAYSCTPGNTNAVTAISLSHAQVILVRGLIYIFRLASLSVTN